MAGKNRYVDLKITDYPAKQKRFAEPVVFVPFFGGTQRHLIRHIRLVNELGFDAIGFDLSFRKRFVFKHIPISTTMDWGIMHIWADEIHQVLESIPGNKHIFSFSNPTTSLLKAMTQLKKRNDVLSIVCDGGPFQMIVRCTWNLAKHEWGINNPLLRSWASAGMTLFWAPDHSKTLENAVKSLPDGFPILSIRAWKDELVPVAAIDKAFEPAKQIDLRTFEIPDAKHLTGLKDSPQLYREKVSSFLIEFATRVHS